MKPLVPHVTTSLVTLNVVAFALELAGGGESVCDAYGLVPAHLTASSLVTSMFLHDPAHWLHIGGNMVLLACFAPMVERALGHLRFIGLYMAAGVVGGLLHVVVDPGSLEPMVGASGAVFGVLAVAGSMRPKQLLVLVLGFVAENLWYAFSGNGGDVSFGTHLGGFAVGVFVVAVARAAGSEMLEA